MPESPPERAAHILVHGRVQGVGFRAWVHHQAELRGLDGWVRNRRDGTVEAYFYGQDHAVEAMLEVCREGPSSARVDRVETLDGGKARADNGEARGFSVLKTV
ncbi:acylphosphatase [Microvirga pudoricolor]|uniref:acylphosphatase n=1 Tax=Microvirga pudoricolor TaxID=2778729 RepID=UPI001E4F30A7|nr:acylphosphatase [Microvirga pudoricolor]